MLSLAPDRAMLILIRRIMSNGPASSVMEPLKYSEVPTNVRKQILEQNE